MTLSETLRNLKRAILIVALLLTGVVFDYAQEAKPDFKITEVSKNELGLNVTSLMLEPMVIEIPDSPKAPLELTSDITYGTQDGKAFTLPPGLNFTSRSTRDRFPRAPNVTIIIDGLPLTLRGVAETASSGKISASSVGEGIASSETFADGESLNVLIPAKTFAALANAKKVEIQVGSFTFSLRENHLKALREMIIRSQIKSH